MTNTNRLFTAIAKRHLNIPTLREQKSDRLDFHDVSVWDVKDALQAAYDAGAKSVTDDRIHQALAGRKQVAVIWSVEDVQEIRPDLTAKQAWEVLQQARKAHDAGIGITWSVLECHAEMLYGYAPEAD
jgi:hypothetical protein